MQENIALIKEVHQGLSKESAEQEALEYLSQISMEDVATKRISECSKLEIFCVMLIRALMCEKGKIVIYFPFIILDGELDVVELFSYIKVFASHKEIEIVDTLLNKGYYMMIEDQKVKIDEL